MWRAFTDQLSRTIHLSHPPKRIVSLVPSQTELLFDLGLDDHIIGVTKFCTHPASLVKNKVKAGGTKKLRIDVIRNLQPDLIIGNKEENERSQIEALMQEFPVWMSDIADVPQALDMIRGIGHLTETENKADVMASAIEKNFNLLPKMSKPLRVAYLIWQGPYMAAGRGTFIDNLLQRCDFINAFKQTRYPEFTEHDLRQANPDVIMLSSEPYPFRQQHISAFKAIVPHAKVILVDGEMFSWYGSRMLLATEYLKQLMYQLSS
ncbi:helical backbone metal receptor [Mucilaginibacter sp. AW1-3]